MKRISTILLVLISVALFAGFSMGSSLEECGDYEHSLKWLKNTYLPSQESINSLMVEWPLIYTGSWSGIFITDLSNPDIPEVTRILEIENSFLEKNQDIGLVRFEQESIISVDLSDPFTPICRDTLDLDLPGCDWIGSINISGDRAYVSTMSHQLLVVDISDLSNLQVTGSWHSPQSINDVEVCDGIVYVGDWKGLHILDISDPDNPHEIAVKDSPRIHFHKNGDLLLALNSEELEVFRLTDPAQPESIIRIPLLYSEVGAVSEDVVVVGFHSLQVYPLNQLAPSEQMVDVGNISYTSGHVSIHNDTMIKTSGYIIELYELQQGRSVSGGPAFYPDNQVTDWSQQGNYVYGTTSDQGFLVGSISDEGEIEIVSETSGLGHLRQIEVAGDLAFVSGNSSWRILDISDPLNPAPLTQPLSLQSQLKYIFFHENQVIVTGDSWVNIYDISNLEDIILTSSTGINYCSSADMIGETLYIGVSHESPHVNIYSVTSGDLQLQGVLDLQSWPVDLEAKDGLLLVNSGTYSHQLYDVSEPSAASLISEIETWTPGKAEFVNDGVMISDEHSLRFYNIDDSMQLDILGAFWLRNMGDYQVMEDGRILVWNSYMTQVVPLPCSWSQPEKQEPEISKTIISASPNPFNPQTNLMFNLPRSGFCSLDIYDLRGRLVQQLWMGDRQAGEQQFQWQGKDEEGQAVPSGVYFARLVYDGGVANRKIVLLK